MTPKELMSDGYSMRRLIMDLRAYEATIMLYRFHTTVNINYWVGLYVEKKGL